MCLSATHRITLRIPHTDCGKAEKLAHPMESSQEVHSALGRIQRHAAVELVNCVDQLVVPENKNIDQSADQSDAAEFQEMADTARVVLAEEVRTAEAPSSPQFVHSFETILRVQEQIRKVLSPAQYRELLQSLTSGFIHVPVQWIVEERGGRQLPWLESPYKRLRI